MMIDGTGLQRLRPVQDPQQRSQVEAIAQSRHAFTVLPPLPGLLATTFDASPMPPLTESAQRFGLVKPHPILLDATNA